MKATAIDSRCGAFGTGTPHIMVRATLDEAFDSEIFVPITITDARASWARGELSALGFDCDTRSIFELDANPETDEASKVLAGVKFEVTETEEEYNGKTNKKYQIVTRTKLTEERIEKLDAMLRGVKRSASNLKPAAAKPATPTTPARTTAPLQAPLPGPKVPQNIL